MARTLSLLTGWTLTDGIIAPMPARVPGDVLTSLRAAGVVAEPEMGMRSLDAVWVQTHRWTYSVSFSCPDEGDERYALEFDLIQGRGMVMVNGTKVADFLPGPLHVDITGEVRPGEENRLSVTVTGGACPIQTHGRPYRPDIGIVGEVTLRATTYVTVHEFYPETSAEGGLKLLTDITFHTAGKYNFVYRISRGNEVVLNHQAEERAPAARQRMQHAVSIENPVLFEPGVGQSALYTVRMSIERTGIGCEMLRRRFGFSEKKIEGGKLYVNGRDVPLRAVRTARPMTDPSLLRAIAQLGINALVLDEGAHFTQPLLDMLDERGILIMSMGTERGRLAWRAGYVHGYTGIVTQDAAVPAMVSPHLFLLMADGQKAWPLNVPLWRLREGDLPDLEMFKRLFGPAILDEPHRLMRISRYMQAEMLKDKLMEARILGQSITLRGVRHAYAQMSTSSLIEYAGALRPAYRAVMDAWAEYAVYVRLEEDYVQPGEQVSIPVYAFSAPRGAVCDVSMHALSGERLAAQTFTQLSQEAIGRFETAAPGNRGVYVLRARMVLGGELLASCEKLLYVSAEDEAPCADLLQLPLSRLRDEGGTYENVGSAALVGMSAPGAWYGVLLPGERIFAKCALPEMEALNMML